MPFKTGSILVGGLLFVLVGSSCGKKETPTATFYQKEDGCLNQIGAISKNFVVAKATPEQWSENFNCIDSKIDFFIKFVKMSSPEGYSQQDVRNLIKNGLITKKKISDEFVNSLFEMKTSIIGGSTQHISPAELKEFVKLLRGFETASLKIIDPLKDYHSFRDLKSLEKLKSQIAESAKLWASYFKIDSTVPFSKEQASVFFRELFVLLELDPKLYEKYADFIWEMKVLVSGGSNTKLESQRWPLLTEELGEIGALYMTYMGGQKLSDEGKMSQNDLMSKYVDLSQDYLERFIDERNGGISLSRVNSLIYTVPLSSVNKEQKTAFVKNIPSFIEKVLKAKRKNTLDRTALRNLFSFIKETFQIQKHLDSIYNELDKQNIKRAATTVLGFVTEANKYLQTRDSVEEQRQVYKLIEISKLFEGLLEEESIQITFNSETKNLRTYTHMTRHLWYYQFMRLLLPGYAKGSKGGARFEDLKELIEDYKDIFNSFEKYNPNLTTEQMTKKRFRDANLFLYVSNGDDEIDLLEGTSYLAMLVSMGTLSSNVFETLSEKWKTCPIVGVDDLKRSAIEMKCFQQQLYKNTETFWNKLPYLNRYYLKISQSKQIELQESLYKAAIRPEMDQTKISLFDLDSFSGLPHYAEVVMDRFDANENQILDKNEILDLAYPIFKQELAKLACKDNDKFLQALLTYAIKFGKLPLTTGDKIQFIAWKLRRPLWKVSADRGDLYKILALLTENGSSSQSKACDEDSVL